MITAQKLETVLKKNTGEHRWHEFAAYMVAIVLCLLILGQLLKLRLTGLTTPITYDGGDALFYSMITKAIITNGWWMTNDSLGAPHGQDLHDFPQNDCFSYLLIKMIGLFTSNYATVYNLFYLITFQGLLSRPPCQHGLTRVGHPSCSRPKPNLHLDEAPDERGGPGGEDR